MKKSVIVEAPAKINLVFDITGRREDGYHLIHSVMQTIDLIDTVTISHMSGSGIYISCDRTRIPCDDNNLAHIAARRFYEAFQIHDTKAISIDLQKRIPVQAGLGGGSADAAAVLVGMNTLFEVFAERSVLCEIGAKVGADVPFCMMGGTMRVQGIGEKLTALPPMPHCSIVVAKPAKGISTVESYQSYDRLNPAPRAELREVFVGLDCGDLSALAKGVSNVLEPATNLKEIVSLKEQMNSCGALGTAMSGSGSAVFGIFESRTLAKRCMRKLYETAESIFLTHPSSRGAVVVRTVGEPTT